MAESKAQKQDRGVDEQETTATSINPRVVDIRQEWDWVKIGIEEVLREHPQLTFRPEDVYTACVTEAALLWVAPEGFVVTTGETDNFTGDRTLLIWIAWAEERGKNCAVKYWKFFAEEAKNAGFSNLEVRTPIPQIEKYLLAEGWIKNTVIYTREL